MSGNRSFWRKVTYIVIIVVLLLPLSWLSSPTTRSEGRAETGGKLSQLREEHKLGQASLGEIDPASETMKLATLGMRGIAVIALWQQANYYKKTENWTKFQASLQQIARLQPNYISVWQYQAWNTSYNLSVEFDDYHDRYAWVIRGINFLKDGLRYNKDEPRLLWDLGWFISQKIGRADERVQYRRLFKRDDVFHAGSGRAFEQRDNWLVGKYWFQEAKDAVDYRDKIMKGKAPFIYRSDPAMAQINYAGTLQQEGTHGDPARNAWVQAGKDWKAYGDDSLLHTRGFRIRLNDLDRRRQEEADYLKQLNELSVGLERQMLEEQLRELTPEQIELSEMQPADVTPDKESEYFRIRALLKITPADVADRIEKDHPELALQASRLGRLWHEAHERAEAIQGTRQTINFNYWKARCGFEQMPEALQGHELLHKASLAHEKQDLPLALELYDQAWPLWRKALDEFPEVRDEGLIGEELVEHIAAYRRVRDDLSMGQFPQDFILRDIVEQFDRDKLVVDVFVDPAKSKQTDEKKKKAPGTSDESTTTTPAKTSQTAKRADGAPPEPDEESPTTTPTDSDVKTPPQSQPEKESGTPPEPEADSKTPESETPAAGTSPTETPAGEKPASKTPAESQPEAEEPAPEASEESSLETPEKQAAREGIPPEPTGSVAAIKNHHRLAA